MKVAMPLMAFGKGGGYKVLSMLANYASEFNVDIDVIVPFNNNDQYYNLNCNIVFINKNGKPVNSFDNEEDVVGIKKLIALYRYLRKNKSKYYSVIANAHPTAYPVVLSGIKNKYYYIQAYEPEFYNEYSGSLIIKYALIFLTWITYFFKLNKIVNSPLYLYYKNIRAKDIVLPGLDEKVFFSKGESVEKKKFTVACIGRREIWKGTKDVVEAVKTVRASGYDINFNVAFLDVSHDIDCTVTYPDTPELLADFYRSADVIVAVGHIQLGAVHYPVIEAMSCGVPIINTGYYPANESNSYIVQVGSHEDVALKIIDIISNKDISECKVKLAKESVKEFSWDVVSKKFYSLITK